ncbi:DMT family transporter [Fulvivirga maritima]|uniref:DMT family transporter n=1 Tax=Fulvivirga maritima TaxID=2904247 RepID=UPI001F28F8F5|nr:DMT family transporter [Fulvivirga maritima]UII26721.1 DMT family transporter [Fulvivirga maritima]
MKTLLLYVLAFTGGIFLAVQAGFNTQLGTILKQPVVAVVASSVFSAIFGFILILCTGQKNFLNLSQVNIPWYLWGIGGLFSMLGISLYFYTIPRLGISKMIVMGLSGQLVFSMLAGRFGWLGLPTEPFTLYRFIGLLLMIGGIFLINSK